MGSSFGEMRRNEFGTSRTGDFNSLRRSHRHYYSTFTADSLSDQLSSFSFLQPKPRSISISPLTSILQQGLCSAKNTTLGSINGDSKVDQRSYGGRCINKPSNQLYLPNLRKNEVDLLQIKQARARVLERQHVRLVKQGLVNRNNGGGFSTGSVGTGVFHPVLIDCTSSQRSSVKKNARQQDDCHYHLPPDMDFFND